MTETTQNTKNQQVSKYRVFAEFENGTEKEIFADTSLQAKAEMSLFLAENKDNVCRTHLDKWDIEMECWCTVNCKLSFFKTY